MKPHRALIALVGFGALVVMLPLWSAASTSGLEPTTAFAASIVLPAAATLFTVSWVEPRLAWPVTGFFVLVGAAALAPTLNEMTSSALVYATGSPAAATVIKITVPVLLLVLIAKSAAGAR